MTLPVLNFHLEHIHFLPWNGEHPVQDQLSVTLSGEKSEAVDTQEAQVVVWLRGKETSSQELPWFATNG